MYMAQKTGYSTENITNPEPNTNSNLNHNSNPNSKPEPGAY